MKLVSSLILAILSFSSLAEVRSFPGYTCKGEVEIFDVLDVYVLKSYDLQITMQEVQKDTFILKGKFQGLTSSGGPRHVNVDTLVPFDRLSANNFNLKPGFLEKKAIMKFEVLSAKEASLSFESISDTGLKSVKAVNCVRTRKKIF